MKKIILLFTFFVILQAKSQVLISQNFNTALGWSTTNVTLDTGATAAAWSRKTVGVQPTCTPFAGTGMAKFTSYDILPGGNGRLTSPVITFAGANYRAKFKMYRDDGYGSDADNVKVYYNTTNNLTGATLLGTVNRSSALAPVVSNNGWYDYGFDTPSALTGTGYIMFLGTSGYGNNIYIDEISIETIPAYDAQLLSNDLNPYIVNGNITINGTIKNYGQNVINSLDVNWQEGTGIIYTQPLTGLNLIANQTYNFTHPNQWNVSPSVTSYSVKVWVSNLNGGTVTDNDIANDQIIKPVYVYNEIFPRNIVYEEATGSWCQYCPRGHVGLKNMEHFYPDDYIGIAVHNNDPMVVTAYNAGIAAFITGYPSGTTNRAQANVDSGYTAIEASYNKENLKAPVGKVAITAQSWNPTTRQISYTAQSQFALNISNANYNLAGVIVENGVTGTTTGYNQVNAYAGGGSGPLTDWEGFDWTVLPNPVPAAQMIYNHVGRALLGGFTGFAGSVPTSLTYNTPYSYTFTHTLPATQNENNIKLVVLLLNNANGQIVNAKQVYLDTSLAVQNFDKESYSIYPNPTQGIVNFTVDKVVTVDIIDITGKVVFSAKNISKDNTIDLSSLQKGTYLVKLTGENFVKTEKLLLN